MIPVFDSNILIDVTLGYSQAASELSQFDRIAISIVTWIEVMAGAKNAREETDLENFMRRFEIVPIDMPIARKASRLRRQFRIKLPDAVIWATAQMRGTLLVTRNARDFPPDDPAIRMPYTL